MSTIVKDRFYSTISDDPRMPKGPALDAFLTDAINLSKVTIFTLIDTGADITCVKWVKIKELETKLGHPLPRERIQDLETGREIFSYEACLVLGAEKFIPAFGIYCPSDALFGLEDALIGRDIQKKLIITLDGPKEVFSIE
jgi:hypothetical protein